MATAALLVTIAKFYGLVGAVFAAAFLAFGLERIDPRARGGYAFRPLLVPGLVLLWPLALARWIAISRSPSGQV
jgi:hypothetical protein